MNLRCGPSRGGAAHDPRGPSRGRSTPISYQPKTRDARLRGVTGAVAPQPISAPYHRSGRTTTTTLSTGLPRRVSFVFRRISPARNRACAPHGPVVADTVRTPFSNAAGAVSEARRGPPTPGAAAGKGAARGPPADPPPPRQTP